jgi:hypothetical protein
MTSKPWWKFLAGPLIVRASLEHLRFRSGQALRRLRLLRMKTVGRLIKVFLTDLRSATTCPYMARTEAQVALTPWHKACTEAQWGRASWRKACMEVRAEGVAGRDPRQALLLDRAAAVR